MLCHVVRNGPHQLLIKSHKPCVTLQLSYVAIGELSRATGVSRSDLGVITTSTTLDFIAWIFYFYLFEHFEHVIFLILLILLILRLNKQLQDFPYLGLLMPAHLQRLRVVHL